MMLFQIFFSLFIIFALFNVFNRFRAKEIGIVWLIFWVLFWLAAEIVAFIPNLSNIPARFLGIGRGADLVVYISLALLFFFFFKLVIRIEKLNRDITKLTRKLSIWEEGK